MARRTPYTLADGTRVPGVTTVLSRFKEAGGLMYWAWDQGRQGKDFREERDRAADAGTVAHGLIEAHFKGDPPLPPPEASDEVKEAALQAFDSFLKWERGFQIRVIAQEHRMVSERYHYGGMLDMCAVVELDGQRAILDWKTSNRLYHDYLMQLAAYGRLWEENRPDEPITGGYHIIRFPKDAGLDFEHLFFGQLDDAWEEFELLLRAYHIDKRLKKRV